MSDDATTAPAENNVAPSSERRNRTSMASRATAEGEALLKEMGFEDKETPGRRRTRASIRGDAYTPPTKKEKKAPTPGTGRRGRPPKRTEEKKEEPVEEDEEEEKEEKKKEEEVKKDVEKEEEKEEKTKDKEKDNEKKDDTPAEATKETKEADADGKGKEEKDDKKEDKEEKAE